MKVRSVLVFVISVSVGFLASPASAQETRTCPHAASGYEALGINDPGWTVRDPVPVFGDEPLWDLVLAGFEEANLTLQEAAEVFGFDEVDELYAFFLASMIHFDKNADRVVCVKELPEASPYPPYIFGFLDNNARVPM